MHLRGKKQKQKCPRGKEILAIYNTKFQYLEYIKTITQWEK